MSERLLAIVDRDPYPPRDGETYPIAAHLDYLARRWQVDVLCVGFAPALESDAERPQLTWRTIPHPSPGGRVRRLVDELLVGRPFFLRDAEDSDRLRELLGDQDYEAVYVSPVRLAEWGLSAREAWPRARLLLGLSDSLTETHRRSLSLWRMPGMAFSSRLKHLARGMRSLYMPRMESGLLAPFDIVLVQSDTDLHAIVRDCGEQFEPKLLVAPNGLREELLELPYEGAESCSLAHVGPVEGERRPLLEWFVDRVFAPLRSQLSRATLHVVGRASDDARRRLEAQDGVICHGFVRDLGTVLRETAMSVAPVFMRCGLINKVVDSLAAGVPVSGIGAFNGLTGFVNGVHGYEAQSAEDWTEFLAGILDDPRRLREMSVAGRELAARQLRWSLTGAAIQDRLHESLSRAA